MNKMIYTCPMHPEVKQKGPGLCPICGMALEPLTPTEDDTEYTDMLRRFWISLLLTIPVLLSSMGKLGGEYGKWIELALSTPVVLWAGWPFFERAWYSILNKSLNMFSLIAMGVGAAYLYSVSALLFPGIFPASFKEHGKLFIYFEAACVIVTLVLLGQVLELKAKGQTSSAIKALLERGAKTAHRIRLNEDEEIPIDQVQKGDILRVKPGEKIPVDGEIIDGSGFVDESMVTGESMPVAKTGRDPVTGGTINQSGSFLMIAKRVGSDTLLARIVQMVSEAQRTRAPIQHLADVVASYFVPLVIFAALITFIAWAIFGPEPRYVYALVNAIAVLIIACPCALGLATPMSIMVGVGKGAEMGILIKNAQALEILKKVDTVVLDKTGTLTEGKPRIVKIKSNVPEKVLLRMAAAVEKNSEHPLAKAILNYSQEQNLSLPNVSQFKSFPGHGVSGVVEGKQILIGKQRLLGQNNIYTPLQDDEGASSIIYVAIDGNAAGQIFIEDPIKESSISAVKDLHKLGLSIIMLTGDNAFVAKSVAKNLGIDQFHANVDPGEKIEVIKNLKSEGRIVAMAGDGINDAPALAAADVGIAMGTGTDVAMESAGITLVKGDLTGIVKAIVLSKKTMQNIRQNLFFAFFYNILGIPIAAGALYPFFGVLLNPMIASGAMALSSVSVILNALRLRKL